jgi:hypothetical protein
MKKSKTFSGRGHVIRQQKVEPVTEELSHKVIPPPLDQRDMTGRRPKSELGELQADLLWYAIQSPNLHINAVGALAIV